MLEFEENSLKYAAWVYDAGVCLCPYACKLLGKIILSTYSKSSNSYKTSPVQSNRVPLVTVLVWRWRCKSKQTLRSLSSWCQPGGRGTGGCGSDHTGIRGALPIPSSRTSLHGKLKMEQDLIMQLTALIWNSPTVLTQLPLSSEASNKTLRLQHWTLCTLPPLGLACPHISTFSLQTVCDSHWSCKVQWQFPCGEKEEFPVPSPTPPKDPTKQPSLDLKSEGLPGSLLSVQIVWPLLKFWFSPSVFLTSVGHDSFDLGKFWNISLRASISI